MTHGNTNIKVAERLMLYRKCQQITKVYIVTFLNFKCRIKCRIKHLKKELNQK